MTSFMRTLAPCLTPFLTVTPFAFLLFAPASLCALTVLLLYSCLSFRTSRLSPEPHPPYVPCPPKPPVSCASFPGTSEFRIRFFVSPPSAPICHLSTRPPYTHTPYVARHLSIHLTPPSRRPISPSPISPSPHLSTPHRSHLRSRLSAPRSHTPTDLIADIPLSLPFPLPPSLSLTQIVTHSATFDFYPHVRHALRATPHGERPLSVAEYEAQAGKAARDWQQDEWAKLGVEARPAASANRPRGYND